jgi:hypothetical protein
MRRDDMFYNTAKIGIEGEKVEEMEQSVDV